MGARAAIVASAVAGALLLAAAPADASITVANQNDAGPGSLRQAIGEARRRRYRAAPSYVPAAAKRSVRLVRKHHHGGTR